MGRGLVIALLVLAATAMGAVVRPSAASSNREDEMRDQIGQFLNMERTNRGLRPLPIDPDLAASAQAWSEHNRDTACETNCHSTHAEGEIIAWADVRARSGQLMVAWMKSGNHRNIVLYPDATAMGVGVACQHGGEVYATVQFYDVYRPVAPTDQDPIATSEDWGAPCEGVEGSVPPTSTSTPTTHRTSPTTTSTTAKPRPTPTSAPPRQSAPATTAAPRPKAAVPPPPPPVTPPAVVTTTSPTTIPEPTTTTTLPRVGLRADGTGVTANPTPTSTDDATLFAESAATPANAEPAWIAIVVVVVLLSGMRVGAQLHEARAARRLEDG